MAVMFRNLLTIILFVFSTSFLNAKVVAVDSLSNENNQVAFLFGLFGGSSDDDEESQEAADNAFNLDEIDENAPLDGSTPEVEAIQAQDPTLEDGYETLDQDFNQQEEVEEKKIRRHTKKSLKGKQYYMSLALDRVLGGNSSVDYFSMEPEDPTIDDSPLIPVFTNDTTKIGAVNQTSIAIGRYFENINSAIELEYVSYYLRATEYNGGSIYSTSDDRLYRSWTSGIITWKYDLFNLNVVQSAPVTVYSILGAGFAYTTLSKKESNMIQFAYSYGLGTSWMLTNNVTLFADFKVNTNVSSLRPFSQGYSQSHNVSIYNLNLGARFYIF